MTTKDTIIQEDGFGFAPRSIVSPSVGNPFNIVRRYTLTNENGSSVRLISWGAGIQSINVPNNRGVLGDVALGFDHLDGTKKYIWGISPELHQIMSYRKRHAGNDGDTMIQTKYSWTNENELNVKINATSIGTIPVNFTNYCPLNLAGHGTTSEELKNHVVTINADKWTSQSFMKNNFSNLECRYVEGGIYDLRNCTKLKNRLNLIPGGGYDHNFFIYSPSTLCYRFHARVLHPGTGRFFEVYSNQPCLHFDTGNNFPDPGRTYLSNLKDLTLGGCDEFTDGPNEMDVEGNNHTIEELRGKDGISYKRQGCFVMSPQSTPARVLYPGKIFEHNITYKFGVRSNNE